MKTSRRPLRWASILLLFTSLRAFAAEDYGSIKVVVLKIEPKHLTLVHLHVNGAQLMSFSHATSKDVIGRLRREHLAENSPTSRVRTDYASLQSDCEFDYDIYYGAPKSSQWKKLGRFHAPSDRADLTIPIGICANGQICSTESEIESELERSRQAARRAEEIKRNVEIAKDQKRDYQNTRARAELNALQGGAVLDRLSARAAVRETPPLSEQSASELRREIDRQMAQSTRLPEVVLPEARLGVWNSAMLEKAIALEESEANAEWKKGLSEDQVAARMGMGLLVWQIADAFVQGLGAVERQQSEVCDSLRPTPKCDALIQQWHALHFGKQQLNHASTFVSVVATGVRIYPGVNDWVDACEIISGIENCIPQGRRLSGFERLATSAGLLVGTGTFWREAAHLSPWFRVLNEGRLMQKIEELGAGAVKHVIFGEYERVSELRKMIVAGEEIVRQAERTALAGGMHTVEAWKVFSRETGVRAIREDVLENGVRVLQLPAEALTDKALRNAMMAGAAKGSQHPIKTLFPSTWSLEQVVEAGDHALKFGKDLPARNNWGGTRVALFKGVEVEVNYVKNGKSPLIKSWYPHFPDIGK